MKKEASEKIWNLFFVEASLAMSLFSYGYSKDKFRLFILFSLIIVAFSFFVGYLEKATGKPIGKVIGMGCFAVALLWLFIKTIGFSA